MFNKKEKKWLHVKMTALKCKGDVIRVYNAYFCPKCNYEAIVQTKYCPECGKKLGKADK